MSSRNKRVHTFNPAADVAPLLAECDSLGIKDRCVNECLRRYFNSQALDETDQGNIIINSVARMTAQERREYADELERWTFIIRASLPESLEAIVNPTGELRGLFKAPSGYLFRETEAEAFQPLTLKDAATKAAELLDQRPHDLETDLGILLRDLAKGVL